MSVNVDAVEKRASYLSIIFNAWLKIIHEIKSGSVICKIMVL